MKPDMTAAKFRAELKRIGFSQSAFAEAVEVPLRTVQSWALDERRIPNKIEELLLKAERLPIKKKIVAQAMALPPAKLKVFAEVVKMVGDHDKLTKSQKIEIGNLRHEVLKLVGEIGELRELVVHQGRKIEVYANEARRRADEVKPFNR